MKKIYYDKGPPELMIINVGRFSLGEPKEVGDEYADALVQKGTFKYFEDTAKSKKGVIKDEPSMF